MKIFSQLSCRSYSGLVTLLICIFGSFPISAAAATYYIDRNTGRDTNTGTSPQQTWRTLEKVSGRIFAAGDSILFARGSVWAGENLTLKGKGTKSKWITVGAYGSGAMPKIAPGDLQTCVQMLNCDHWIVEDLELADGGHGLIAFYSGNGHEGLKLSGLYIHDVNKIFHHNPSDPNPYAIDWNSTGISVGGRYGGGPTPTFTMKNVLIERCRIKGAGRGITMAFNARIAPEPRMMKNIEIRNNYIENCDDGSLQIERCENVQVYDNYFNIMFNGKYAPENGSTGAFLTDNYDITFANNIFKDVIFTNVGDESCVDVDEFNDRVKFYGNYITGAAGGGIQFLINDRYTGAAKTYNTNHEVLGNTIVGNSKSHPPNPEWYYYFGAMNFASVRPDWNFTGKAKDNLWHDHYGFTRDGKSVGHHGDWSKWIFSHNIKLISATSVYNSAMGYDKVQGANRWSYQYRVGDSYINFTYNPKHGGWGINGSNNLDRFNFYPIPKSNNWVVRTWRAPATGKVSIRGRVFMNTPGSGNGVKVRITRNGKKLWPANRAHLLIPPGNTMGFNTYLDNVTIKAGDLIRFEVQGTGQGSDGVISWMPSVGYTVIRNRAGKGGK